MTSHPRRGRYEFMTLPSREREVWIYDSPVRGEGGMDLVISREGRGDSELLRGFGITSS